MGTLSARSNLAALPLVTASDRRLQQPAYENIVNNASERGLGDAEGGNKGWSTMSDRSCSGRGAGPGHPGVYGLGGEIEQVLGQLRKRAFPGELKRVVRFLLVKKYDTLFTSLENAF